MGTASAWQTRVPEGAPYNVEVVDAAGRAFPLYSHRGQLYLQGDRGRRYKIRVSNPTPHRVEAVVSVDGLDVIDGKSANYRSKRGYIIAPYGHVDIDGWRTSQEHVAAFRFSPVSQSYAGLKGKARNVGVIGVAFFSERVHRHRYPRRDRHQGYRRSLRDQYDLGEAPAGSKEDSASPPSKPGELAQPSDQGSGLRRSKKRPGLGTGWGEQRYSHVDYTRFTRRHTARPEQVMTLRYNDRKGLRAAGVPLQRPWDEVAVRESANPFPGMQFAQPPRSR